MNKISVILPIHKIDDDIKKYFEVAINSVCNQIMLPDELLIVCKNDDELINYLSTYDYKNIQDIVRIVINENETNFVSQFNLGVKEAKYEWISLLEFDDEYSSNWFNNVKKYMEFYKDVKIFLPLIVDVNDKGDFLGFMNEAVWAHQFSEELGFLDLDSLLNYQNFNIDGMVCNKEFYLKIGGLKKNIKLTFIYEFFLRSCYMSGKIMVIPKIGYKHLNLRAGSLFDNYKKELNASDTKFWLEVAKKEYYFETDRIINNSVD